MMATRYAQGTIWARAQTSGKRGKQSGAADGGLVMVISNSAFNAASGIVNCLAVTDTPQSGKTHVPLQMDKPQFICCEQLQTIPAQDLQQFYGVVSVAALDAVKKKLRAQFDIVDEQDYWAGKSFEDGDAATEQPHAESEAAQAAPQTIAPQTTPQAALASINAEPSKRRGNRKKDTPKPKGAAKAARTPKDTAKAATTPKGAAKAAKSKKAKDAAQPARTRHNFTPEDVAFILDKANDVKALMEKYGFPTQQAAYNARARLKKKETGK